MNLEELKEIKESVETAGKSIEILSNYCLLPDDDRFWGKFHEFLINSAEEAKITDFNLREHFGGDLVKMISEKIKKLESEIITDSINSQMGVNIE